ncbi:MAG: peroxisomal biogenesis factor 11 [Benjaminiella poitrasii]|nr:MAG: peroxisomal biogenesis factor 11 [Benjaminiella poitrasii]
MFPTDAQITLLNNFLAVTNSREKLYRFIQYFARFYVFYLLRRGNGSKQTIQRWNDLKSHLSTGRKLFRLLKPVELAQSSIKAVFLHDPVLRVTQFIKFASNFLYFTFEALSLVDAVNFYKFRNMKRINEFGLKCWFLSLVASSISSVYNLKKLETRMKALKNENFLDDADSKIEQKTLLKQIDTIKYQLYQDLTDMCIPVGSLRWLPLGEPIIGIAGMITSMMAMNTQWKKINLA